ncbi:MAG: hypothetical protein AAF518_20355 [Spirochaetota bacterium]
MSFSTILYAIVFFLFFYHSSIFAQVWVPAGQHLKTDGSSFSLDLGANKYDGDFYIYINPGLSMEFQDTWGFSIQAPVNILAKDNTPLQTDRQEGQIRKIDYDHPSDYQKLINNIWYGNYGDYKPGEITFSAYVGRMNNGFIGHGTIINRYVNNPRIEQYKLGAMVDVNTDYGGIQGFSNSLYDRDVNAGRAYIRPYAVIAKSYYLISGRPAGVSLGNVIDEAGRKKVFEEADEEPAGEETIEEYRDEEGRIIQIVKNVPSKKPIERIPKPGPYSLPGGFNPDSIWNKFAIGGTIAVDGRSPYQLDFDTTGALSFDENDNPMEKNTKRVTVVGTDIEFQVFRNRLFEITPYADFNRIRRIDNAKGEHYGIKLRVGNKKINLTLQPEYRRMTSTYLPVYFDSFYEIERYQYDVETGLPRTKYEYMSNLEPFRSKRKGQYHTLILNIYKIGFEVVYEKYDGVTQKRPFWVEYFVTSNTEQEIPAYGSVFVGAYIPLGRLLLSGFYAKKGFEKGSEAFKVDDRSQGVVEAALNLGFLSIRLQNWRRWVLDEEENRYKAFDEQKVLFSGSFSF